MSHEEWRSRTIQRGSGAYADSCQLWFAVVAVVVVERNKIKLNHPLCTQCERISNEQHYITHSGNIRHSHLNLHPTFAHSFSFISIHLCLLLCYCMHASVAFCFQFFFIYLKKNTQVCMRFAVEMNRFDIFRNEMV